MGKVIAVCTSERKGIQKTSVPEIKVIETGESRVMPMPANGTVR